VAAVTIDVDMTAVLASQAAILAALARLETKVDALMTEAQNTQAQVAAEAAQIGDLDTRLTNATTLLQAFLDANAGGPLDLSPVEAALAHLAGTVGGVESVATAETPPPPPPPPAP
jgi:hypothetical protein